MRLAVVIPAYNEAKSIAKVISSIPRKIKGTTETSVIVVDDGSSDNTRALAQAGGAITLRHRINLGAGAATLTGISAAKRLGFDSVVILDADGQHDPKEIDRLVGCYKEKNADLIIGSRFLSETIDKMPLLKRVGNQIMNIITYIFSGKMVTDSQSGFRLFGERMLAVMDGFTTSGYEFQSETIVNANRHHFSIVEVPISTIYLAGRQGQSPVNGVNILLQLFIKRILA